MIPAVSPYLLFNGVGLMAALFLLEHSLKKRVPECQDCAYVIIVFGGVAGWLGAYAFDWLTRAYWSGSAVGFTFYGGLITGLAFVICFGSIFMTPIQLRKAIEACVLPLVIAHALGRIGCFLEGCCYGRPISGTGLLHPTQLYESFFLFLLAGTLIYTERYTKISPLNLYFFSYPVFRFFVEFFRGDDRGSVLGMSTSQWVSIGLLSVAVLAWLTGTEFQKTERKLNSRRKTMMFKTIRLLFIFLLAILLTSLFVGPALAQNQVFTLYVSAPTRDGFLDTSKEIQDSIKDINKHLKGEDGFQVVDKAENADIVITVVARGVGSTAFGQRTEYNRGYYTGTTVSTVPMVANTYWVTGVLKIGNYQKEFTGSRTNTSKFSSGAWGYCAQKLADNFKAWATANRDQIAKLREEAGKSK